MKNTRQKLRVIVKLMIVVAFSGLLYAFFQGATYVEADEFASERLQVDLSRINEGEARYLTWQTKPVMIVHRRNEWLNALRQQNSDLRNEDDMQSDIVGLLPRLRSLDANYLVIFAYNNELGCPVELDVANAQLMSVCGNTRYDLAGRVYAGQFSTSHLRIPEHFIEGNTLYLQERD